MVARARRRPQRFDFVPGGAIWGSASGESPKAGFDRRCLLRHEFSKLALVRTDGKGFACGMNGDPVLYPLSARGRLERSSPATGERLVEVVVTVTSVCHVERCSRCGHEATTSDCESHPLCAACYDALGLKPPDHAPGGYKR